MRKRGYILYTLLFAFVIFYLASCSTSEERRWDFPEAHSNPEVCDQYLAKDLCYSEVASFRQEPAMCELIKDNNATEDIKDFCYFKIAIDWDGVAKGAQNPALCENIKEKFQKENCYYQTAQNSKDPEGCEKLSNDDPNNPGNKDSCYSAVAQLSGDHTICSRSEDINNEYRCYTFVADSTGDASVCESIKDFPTIKSLCIAQAKRDPELCGKLPEAGNTRDACYINVASSTKNKKLCSQITNEGIRDDCLSLNIFKRFYQ